MRSSIWILSAVALLLGNTARAQTGQPTKKGLVGVGFMIDRTWLDAHITNDHPRSPQFQHKLENDRGTFFGPKIMIGVAASNGVRFLLEGSFALGKTQDRGDGAGKGYFGVGLTYVVKPDTSSVFFTGGIGLATWTASDSDDNLFTVKGPALTAGVGLQPLSWVGLESRFMWMRFTSGPMSGGGDVNGYSLGVTLSFRKLLGFR